MAYRIPKGKLVTACSISRVLAVFLICLVPLWIPRPTYAIDPEPINVKWQNPVKQPLSLSMSAGGQYCGIVEKGGIVRIYGPKGKLQWKQQVKGATDVMVARNGQSVLVYSRLNPIYQEVNFFRMNGSLLWTCRVKGCVWSGAVSADGVHAAVTTGERYVYLYEADPHRPSYRRWRLQGIGYSLLFTPDNKRVVVGTYQKPMLACYDLTGEMLWSSKCDSERQFELRVSADSKSIVGVIPATRYNPGAEIRFWSSGGHLVWRQPLQGFDAHALVSPQSQYVAVSYANTIPSRKGGEIVERKVAVYKANGGLLWDKGGLFFGPHLVALSPTGSSVIVSDGEHSVFNIDQRGRILSKMNMNGSIRTAVSTEDGRRILLYCGDDWLYLMGVG
jgi:hypothetical protein